MTAGRAVAAILNKDNEGIKRREFSKDLEANG